MWPRTGLPPEHSSAGKIRSSSRKPKSSKIVDRFLPEQSVLAVQTPQQPITGNDLVEMFSKIECPSVDQLPRVPHHWTQPSTNIQHSSSNDVETDLSKFPVALHHLIGSKARGSTTIKKSIRDTTKIEVNISSSDDEDDHLYEPPAPISATKQRACQKQVKGDDIDVIDIADSDTDNGDVQSDDDIQILTPACNSAAVKHPLISTSQYHHKKRHEYHGNKMAMAAIRAEDLEASFLADNKRNHEKEIDLATSSRTFPDRDCRVGRRIRHTSKSDTGSESDTESVCEQDSPLFAKTWLQLSEESIIKRRSNSKGEFLRNEMKKYMKENHRENGAQEPTKDEVKKQIFLPKDMVTFKEPLKQWVRTGGNTLPGWDKTKLPEEEVVRPPDWRPPTPPRVDLTLTPFIQRAKQDLQVTADERVNVNQQTVIKEFKQSADEYELRDVRDDEIILVMTGCGLVRFTKKEFLSAKRRRDNGSNKREYGQKSRRRPDLRM